MRCSCVMALLTKLLKKGGGGSGMTWNRVVDRIGNSHRLLVIGGLN